MIETEMSFTQEQIEKLQNDINEAVIRGKDAQGEIWGQSLLSQITSAFSAAVTMDSFRAAEVARQEEEAVRERYLWGHHYNWGEYREKPLSERDIRRARQELSNVGPTLFELLQTERDYRNPLQSPKEIEESNKKAKELLLSILTPDQIETYENYGYVDIEGNWSGNIYRVDTGTCWNVTRLDGKDKSRYSYSGMKMCATPKETLPAGDRLATQILFIQTNEQEFLRVANKL